MAGTTLGLDLGTNSIGWALIDESGRRIIATGVRVFPEGVDRDQQGGEKSKNEQRRIARGMRRQIARRARRKRALRAALIQAGLFPVDAAQQEALLQLDPYELRRKALTEPLQAWEIGRLVIHLDQRRGFKSNRKEDRKKKKENSELLAEISQLAAEMGKRTLGQYLVELRGNDPAKFHLTRLRGRHTRRDMYEAEFDAIWSAQQPHHPTLLTDTLKYGRAGKQIYPQEPRQLSNGSTLLPEYGLYGIIFYQRPMYWPKSVVGACELEPKLKRCPRADRAAQRFRLLQEVNNLRVLDNASTEERPLTPEERSLLIEYLAPAKERKFDDIRKMFCKKLRMPETIRFNLERGDRKKLLGMPTDAILAHKDLFGKAWHDRDDKDQIVRSLLDDDEQAIHEKAFADWGLDAETAERLIDADLEGKESKGYSSFSRAAIEKLLPHLEQGLIMMTRDGTPCALSEAGYLRPDQRVVNEKDSLAPPPALTNPLVRQALHEVRKVVNAIIREYGKPSSIHIELAREVKGTAKDRARYSRDIHDREEARDYAAEEIRKAGIKVTSDAIDRYLVWNEQKRVCVYCGRPISFAQLFGGEIDIDHILPRDRSLDNSLMNRVLCFRSENAGNNGKGQRTPFEWLAATDPGKYDAVLQRTACLPYPKARKFRQTSLTLDDFFARQFVDTAYITTQVHDYVRCLGADILCPKGQHTAELRRHWGLNTVLRHDNIDLKNREDHRHHAVDAIIIALTSRSRLQQLSAIHRRGGTERTGEILPDPWDHFRSDVEHAVNAINVSHRARRAVKGALHNEMLFGPTKTPGVYVKRKPVAELTKIRQLEKIRDVSVRQIIKSHIQTHAGSVDVNDPKSAIPSTVWKTPVKFSKSQVEIRRVRMLEEGESYEQIRPGQFVELSRNHHFEILEVLNPTGDAIQSNDQSKVRDGVLVPVLEAKRRLQRGDPVVQRRHGSDKRFVMSLSINEMFLLDMEDGSKLLHRVQKMSNGSIILRPHNYAGKVSDTDKPPTIQRRTPNTLRGKKVIIDSLGRMMDAND